MRTRLHLICAPWHPSNAPSIQLGALKAWMDLRFGKEIQTYTYSAHLEIPWKLNTKRDSRQPRRGCAWSEAAYQRLYESRKRIRGKFFSSLDRVTRAFVETQIVPQLKTGELNVIGFSLRHYQLYASAYMARLIEEAAPSVSKLFLFGGIGIGPSMERMRLQELKLPGYGIVGEGEQKLEAIVKACLNEDSIPSLCGIAGVIRLGGETNSVEVDECSAPQVKLSDLPLPDYGEYFKRLRSLMREKKTRAASVDQRLAIEGSRGCFVRCGFCALNTSWIGYRTISSEKVFTDVTTMIRRYKCRKVVFVDNVCDSWAEKFAELIIESGLKIEFVMELRADHPDEFWETMKMAGLVETQVGIEALSPPLLALIAKKTKVIDNLRALKNVTELDLRPANNVITHYPGSTVADVEESSRVLEQIPHFWPVSPARFRHDLGSRISREAKGNLPELEEAVCKAWDEFSARYRRKNMTWKKGTLIRTVISDGSVRVADRRTGKKRIIELSGESAKVHEACHSGLKLQDIVEVTKFDSTRVAKVLDDLCKERLVIEVEGYFMSLALRFERMRSI